MGHLRVKVGEVFSLAFFVRVGVFRLLTAVEHSSLQTHRYHCMHHDVQKKSVVRVHSEVAPVRYLADEEYQEAQRRS